MRDFTLGKYKQLLEVYKNSGYRSFSYEEFFALDAQSNDERAVVLRHDVDKRPENSILTAKLEAELGMKGTYYFRIVPESFDVEAIKIIRDLGHEIGYHYEELSLKNGDIQKAMDLFHNSLEKFREFYPLKTICMHGSPVSKWDNRDLWKENDYKQFGIIAEPYFDTDFNKVFYVTDTGRSWNKTKVSVRDKVSTQFSFNLKKTDDLINLIKSGKSPEKIMQNIHPQRWDDNLFHWTKELIVQNVKNQIKKAIFVVKK